jgi:hypothetical protein
MATFMKRALLFVCGGRPVKAGFDSRRGDDFAGGAAQPMLQRSRVVAMRVLPGEADQMRIDPELSKRARGVTHHLVLAPSKQ